MAAVEFVFRSQEPGLSTNMLVGMTDIEGAIEIPKDQGRYPDLALVKPVDGHWNCMVECPSNAAICQCHEIDLERALGWWKALVVGAERAKFGHGIRVGIVDIGFRAKGDLSHLRCFDIEGVPLESARPASHGMRVSKIIGSKDSSMDSGGIAPHASLFLVDVTDDDAHEMWDFEKLFAAIRLLTDEFQVDVINISGGFALPPPTAGEQRRWAIEFARSEVARAVAKGAVLVAAAGNASEEPVAAPACLEDVLGVGAIGMAGLAPKYTNLYGYEQLSFTTQGCFGTTANGNSFFHHLDTSFGEGVDVVGPGLGIVLRFDDGVVAEYDGTSYAAPVVTATIACLIERDQELRRLEGRDRVQYVQRLVKDACIDLGLDRTRQGWGLPILREGVV